MYSITVISSIKPLLYKVKYLDNIKTSPQLITQYDTEAIETRVGCVASAMQIIGNKWTALVLKELATGPKRFGELQKAITGLNPRTLSQRLDELEQCAILTKESFAEVPPRVEYTLTPKGQDLVPVLRQMAAWGDKYYTGNEA